jgi:hypothetical protein
VILDGEILSFRRNELDSFDYLGHICNLEWNLINVVHLVIHKVKSGWLNSERRDLHTCGFKV